LGENEIRFRALNERLEELNETFVSFTGTMTIVCECGDAGCIDQVTVTPSEYERVRADPVRFFVKPGHVVVDVEVVVEANDRFEVVEKRSGEPADLAIEHDPRQG
jgi:hypothetical protein